MPKSKTITTAMRLDIINAVVTYTMAHREKVQEDAELVLSQAIYRQCVPDSLLEQLMKLPKEFLTWHAHLRVQFQKDDTKLDHNIDMKMPVPSTVRYDHYTAFICTNTDLMEQAQEIQKRKNKLKKQRDTLRSQVDGLLGGARSTKQLFELWPDLSSCMPTDTFNRIFVYETQNLPAVQRETVMSKIHCLMETDDACTDEE